MTENLELAYFAGFFDGEGSIVISTSEKLYHSLTISVAQTYPVPLYRMQDRFGGTVSYKEPSNGNKPLYDWRVHSYSASEALSAMREFLIVKRDEADLAIEFQEKLTVLSRDKREEFRVNLIQLHKRRFKGNFV